MYLMEKYGINAMELVKAVPATSNMGFGGFFGFIGNQIYNAAEQLGINKVYNDTKNSIDSKLNEYGIKDTMAKGYDYAKSAGGYIVDKTKEIASSDVVQGTVNKVKEGVNYVNESATNMLNNFTGNNDNNNESDKNNQENNLDFLKLHCIQQYLQYNQQVLHLYKYPKCMLNRKHRHLPVLIYLANILLTLHV